MSTLKVNAIRGTGASSDAISVNSTDGTCTANITNKLHKNLIINGAMQVAQRGTSTSTNGGLCCDRWKCQFAGTDEAPTFTQHALTSSDTGPWAKGFRNSLRVTNGNQTSGAGATDEVNFYYQFEAQDLATSGWDYTSTSSYITFSFWVKSSVAQNFYGAFTSRDGTNYAYPFETGSLSANTWTKITKTIPGNSNIQIDNDTGEGMTIHITPFYGTDYTASGVTLNQWGVKSSSALFPDNTTTWFTTNDATFEITGVQLTATEYCPDYPHISFAEELARCQRYCYVEKAATGDYVGWTGLVTTDTAVNTNRTLPVPMRAIPSYTGTATDCEFQSYDTTAMKHFSDGIVYRTPTTVPATLICLKWDVSSTTAGHFAMCRCKENASQMIFSAEL